MSHDYFPQYALKHDYTVNATSFSDFLAKHNELMKYLSKRVWEYDKELQKRFLEWDANLASFDEDVIKLLNEWIDDGTFADIINNEIFADHMARFAQHDQDIAELEKQLNSENVYLGFESGKTSKDTHTAGVDSGNYSNTAIGGFAMTNNFRGWKNTAIGHLALADNTGGYYNVAVGDSALEHNIGDNGQTGTSAGDAGARNTALGSYALRYNKSGRGNVGIGRNAAHANESGNYNTAIGTNAYSGSVQDGNNDNPKSAEYNTAIGYNSLFYTNASDNIAIGYRPLYSNISGVHNIAIGNNANIESVDGSRNVSVGHSTLRALTSGLDNVAMGHEAMRFIESGDGNTAIGDNALRYNMDGTEMTSVSNSIAIGKQSRVTGNEQLQLGTAGITSYSYGAVQSRSDKRDKADIRETIHGLDFINQLKPVDFRWNYRDDYVEFYEEDGITKTRNIENNGSKKRRRYHHGFLAQDVKETVDKTGIDFGGLQDHTVNGGQDVLSLGHDEFIAPLVKAIQQLTARVEELEKGVST